MGRFEGLGAEAATIRRYEDGDGSGIAGLIVSIQRDEFGIPITLADQPDLMDVPGYYRRGAGDFWVAAASAGDIVGTIALIDIGNRQGALRKMFVHRDWRGRERGVAQRLLRVLLGHAGVAGLAEIFLGTTAKFLAAHRFYERNGFTLVAADDLPPAFPRMAVDTRFYRLRL